MTINIVNLATAQFVDVNGVGRFLYGCPLTERETLALSLSQTKTIAANNPALTIAGLLKIDEFDAAVRTAARVTGLQFDWLYNGQSDLIFEMMLLYQKDDVVYSGDLESIEFGYRHTKPRPAKPPLDLPRQTKFFDELWFYDCSETLRKVKDPDIYNCARFHDLVAVLTQLMGERGLDELWDTEPMGRELITECLGLFELSPEMLSATMVGKLLLSDDWLPGHLHQLIAAKPAKDGKPLPDGENAVDAAIAGFISEHYPINVTIESLRGIPQKQLSSIIKSRNRMIEEMRSQSGGRKGLTEEEADMHRQNIESSLGILGNPQALADATKSVI